MLLLSAERRGAAEYGSMPHDWQPSILQLVIFRLEEQQYALPLSTVERVLPMIAVSPLPHAPPLALGMINVHGTIVPVLDLRYRFGLPPRAYGLAAHLLLARTTRRLLAVPVDEVVGVRDVVAAAITLPDAILPGITQVVGIVALTHGLLFIHDLETLLSLEEEQRLTDALEETAPCS